MNPRNTSAIWRVVAALIGLPIVYVLSIGPVQWAIWHGVRWELPMPGVGQAAHAVYAPLRWAGDRSKTFEVATTRYLCLWVDLAHGPGTPGSPYDPPRRATK